ncbi:MAG: ferritin family protein [Bacillota bacterium]
MEGKQFNAHEVLEMAREIEKKGMNYYQIHADITDDKKIRDLFLRLKNEEKKHYDTFSNLKNEVKENKNKYDYLNESEVIAYLRTLVEFSIFPASISRKEAETKSVDEILLTAIMAEKESILFYRELVAANKGESLAIINTLIEEEKQHLVDLTEISRDYS